MTQDIHKPVLLDQVLSVLKPKGDERYLDLTAGYGGHAMEVAKRLNENGHLTLVDRDINAIDYLKQRFKQDSRVEYLHKDFLSASTELLNREEKFDCILADIGVSSPHLDNPDRGFSFMNDGPLDMRMDQSSSKSAMDVVNSFSQEKLADILYIYGELRNSRRLADIIVQNRPFSTTNELASVIPGSYKQRMRTLAQVFQALRIEVNDELEQLKRSLPILHSLLNQGGRLAVISFHSLEDRIVKQYFSEHGTLAYGNDLKIITKKPLVATQDELVFNPRARSAKLRCVQRK